MIVAMSGAASTAGIPGSALTAHDPIPLARSEHHVVILRVGTRPDRVWHFWAAPPEQRSRLDISKVAW